ncbi:MAG: hypothetical protein QXK08_00580 [Candidatus Woesearchaeota archaeon]
MKKQGAISIVDVLVQLGLAVIAMLVIFIVFSGYKSNLMAAGEKAKCEWSVVMAALSKAGTGGFSEGIPEGCRAKIMNVTMDDLRKKYSLAKTRMALYGGAQYQNVIRTFTPDKADNEAVLNEFAVDKIVADEMVSCWEKVFKGKMPLFDEWWRLYDFPWSKTERNPETAVQNFAGTFGRPPVNCILCAHIKFMPEVINAFKAKPKITSMDEWMLANPVPLTSKDYLNFLAEGQPDVPHYEFSVDANGLAVVYARVNEHAVKGYLQSIPATFGITTPEPKDYNMLFLVPYTQTDIVDPASGIGCTLIID